MRNFQKSSEASILLQKTEREMKLRGRAKSTAQTYCSCLKRFFNHFKKADYSRFTLTEIREFQEHLIDSKVSAGHINQHLYAIQFFYSCIIKTRRFDIRDIGRMPMPKLVPTTIPRETIKKILDNTSNLKFKILFMLMYATGMRVKEATTLKIEDIKTDRMLILIRQSKRNKERFVPMDKQLLRALRFYYASYPVDKKEWMFPKDRNMFHPVTTHHVQTEMRKVRRTLRLSEDYTCHCFRHSFASHLLEDGTDIRIIQKLLGHADISTTTHYVSVSEKAIKSITLPTTKLAV